MRVPVISVAKFDLERLVGAKFDEIVRALNHVKCEIEESAGDSLKLEVTHDRPDHFSAEGLARTVRGVLGIETGLPPIRLLQSDVVLEAGVIEERPYISMAIVRGVTLDNEAIRQVIQLQEKLHETYGRSRRKVAIGLYDMSRVKPPIRYTRVSAEDEYVPLGFDRPVRVRDMFELTEQGRRYSRYINRDRPPALVDGAGQILTIIPVLGSECCKVTESTRDVLIDVTGTDPRAVVSAMSVLVYGLLERSASKEVALVSGGLAYVHSYIRVRADVGAISELLGVRLALEEFAALVRRARMDYSNGEVVVPPYRINVLSWVDVAEDVALMMSYDAIPREVPRIVAGGRRHRVEVFSDEVRRALLAMGFAEVSNYMLTDESVARVCKPARVLNPVSEMHSTVRCSLITQLVATAAQMRRGGAKIFEVGDVVRDGRTVRAAAFLISHDGVTLTDGLSVLKALCRRLGLECRLSLLEAEWALRGRAALVQGGLAGYIAEVSPDLLVALGHRTPTVVAELFLE